jgi:hypothetical protein
MGVEFLEQLRSLVQVHALACGQPGKEVSLHTIDVMKARRRGSEEFERALDFRASRCGSSEGGENEHAGRLGRPRELP